MTITLINASYDIVNNIIINKENVDDRYSSILITLLYIYICMFILFYPNLINNPNLNLICRIYICDSVKYYISSVPFNSVPLLVYR